MNNINITGEYTFEINFQNMFNNKRIQTPTHHNIITKNGTIFFLNRLINNNNNITSITIGTGTKKPDKNDTDLEQTTTTLNNINKTIKNNKLILSTTTQGNKILNCTEIGVKTDNQQLISRNTHNPLIVPSTATVNIEYIYSFTDGEYKTGWTKTENKTNTYQTENDLGICSVIESQNTSYKKVDNLNDVENNECTYFNNTTEKTLYIHPSNNLDPNALNIIIIYENNGV